MSRPPLAFAEIWRVLAYTLVVAIAFLALGRLQQALVTASGTQQWLQRLGWIPSDPAAALQQQTAQIAAASAEALQRLPRGHRTAALRLGYELGYASQLIGVNAMSPPAAQALGRQQAAPHAALAAQVAAAWGLGEARPLGAASLREFTELGQRYEADENGLAARVETQMSPLHRHLYLLGTLLGGEMARVEGSGGRFALPPAAPIRRHAVLAGIDAAVWQPLIAEPRDEAPAQVVLRYRRAVDALALELERLDNVDAPPAR